MRNQWDLKENQQETSEGHAKPTRHTWKSRRSLEKPTGNHREIKGIHGETMEYIEFQGKP